MKRALLMACAVWFVGALLFEREAAGHPGWARKYGTSCATCHVAFPNLTPFGEAFRRNGYRFPEGADEDYLTVNPVTLGAPSMRKVFPDSLWPSDLPGIAPISVIGEGQFEYSPDDDNKTSFEEAGAELEIVGGWTLGETLSMYAELGFEREGSEETEAELERLFVDWLAKGTAVKVRMGRFEPDILNISNHRRIAGPKYFATAGGFYDNEFSFEGAQQGIEVGGSPNGRVHYAVGVVEGNRNDTSQAKDHYASIGYKFGGMRLDGVVEDEDADATANPRPWAERSTTVKGFWYRGRARLADGAGMEQTDAFDRAGLDMQVRYDDLVCIVGTQWLWHEQPTLGSARRQEGQVTWAEVDYVLFPWLIPQVRWDQIDADGMRTRDRYSVFATFMARANVKGFVGYIYDDGQTLEREVVVGGQVAF